MARCPNLWGPWRRRHGADVANTEQSTRSVVILGYPGVQALDLVGPFEVFTGATLYLAGQGRGDEGYHVTLASRRRRAGQHRHRAWRSSPNRCPTHVGPSTPWCCPAASASTRPGRTPTSSTGSRPSPSNARRVVSVCTGAFLAAQAGLLDGCTATTHWAFAGPAGTRIPFGRCRSRSDLRAQFADGMDRGRRHRRHRPGAVAGRGRLRHRRRADGRSLAGAVPAAARRADPVRRAGVDAPRKARADPRRPGGHRGRTRWRAQHLRPWPVAPR